MIWLALASMCMVVTAVLHSLVGERRLIGPMLALDVPLMRIPLARNVIRFAWHITSLFMLLTAALVLWPGTPRSLLVSTGVLWLVIGVFDGFYTNGKHLGWPVLTASGALTLIGVFA